MLRVRAPFRPRVTNHRDRYESASAGLSYPSFASVGKIERFGPESSSAGRDISVKPLGFVARVILIDVGRIHLQAS
jgi:hypothetical protein